jgi:hypothetical protein
VLANLAVGNNGVTFVDEQMAFIVNGNKNFKKKKKKIRSDCFRNKHATGTCCHILHVAARLQMGVRFSIIKSYQFERIITK